MEEVLASPTPLARQLFVTTDDTVANGTLCLSLERTRDVFPPGRESVDQIAILDKERLPLAFMFCFFSFLH